MGGASSGVEILQALLPFVVIFVLFYFFLIRPQRVQAKKHKEMLDALKKGDKVVSSGGFICEIIKVEADFLAVRLSDDSTARLSRDFIAYKVQPQMPVADVQEINTKKEKNKKYLQES